jgi:hypothetical protein
MEKTATKPDPLIHPPNVILVKDPTSTKNSSNPKNSTIYQKNKTQNKIFAKDSEMNNTNTQIRIAKNCKQIHHSYTKTQSKTPGTKPYNYCNSKHKNQQIPPHINTTKDEMKAKKEFRSFPRKQTTAEKDVCEI